MKKIVNISASLLAMLACAAAQENIPDAAPLEDEPLQVNPAQDSMDIAQQLYNQALATDAKKNPEEYRRLMELCMNRYLDVVQRFPQADCAPLAKYSAAMCMTALGLKADARRLFRDLAENGSPRMAGAAAYRLATDAVAAGNNDEAAKYYRIVVQKTDQNDLMVDAQYRLGKLLLQQGDEGSASTLFCQIIGNKKADSRFVNAARMANAAACSKAGRLGAALQEYLIVADTKDVEADNRAFAVFRAAGLAEELKQHDRADELYGRLLTDASFKKYAPNGLFGAIKGLFRKGKYKEALTLYEKNKALAVKDKRGQVGLNMLLGECAFKSAEKKEDFQKAADFYLTVEKVVPNTETAMQASYSRLLCYDRAKEKDVPHRAQLFLNHYAEAYPTSKLNDMVRLVAAENLFSVSPKDAANFYAHINIDNVPEEIRPSILYKGAWALSKAQNRRMAIELLSKFIELFPNDKRMCEVLVLRGDMYAKTQKDAEALQDFALVINRWPKEEKAMAAWQRAAQIYAVRQDMPNMGKYYAGLIENFPNASPAVLSEARFSLGRADFDRGEYKSAIKHLTEADTLNSEKYGEKVAQLVVLCYHREHDFEQLAASLENLEKKYPQVENKVPSVIFAWLGSEAYRRKELKMADKYLTKATDNDKQQNVKKVIWRNLAKVRLMLKDYERALVASDNFLKEESQPFLKADGMLDKASILLGLGKYADARSTAEEALALGVEGPLMASLKIVLGDISFAEKKYDEAAKYYGVTAELFVNDAELKPRALYKAAEALEKAGRKSEASQYRARLEREFKDWKPE